MAQSHHDHTAAVRMIAQAQMEAALLHTQTLQRFEWWNKYVNNVILTSYESY